MRTVATLVIIGLVVFGILMPGIGCGKSTPATNKEAPVAPQTAQDTKTLFETSCSKCHPTAKVEAYSKSETWKAIVDRMITKHGAKISPEDAIKIVAYLENTYKKQ
jgi:hypothetical protein